MENISIINKNSIMRKFGKYITLGLVGLIAYFGIGISKNVSEYLRYSSRKASIERLVQRGEIEEAESVLNSFTEWNSLEKPDLEALSIKLKAERRDKETKELEGLINEGNYGKAQEKYTRLIREGILDSENSMYPKKIFEISLESRLMAIKQTFGEDKIKNIESLIFYYPDYEKIDELKQQQIQEYIPLITFSFSSNINEEKLSVLLKGFNASLRQLNSSKLNNFLFDALFSESDKYVNRMNYVNSNSIEIGDNVKLVKKLGKFNSEDEDKYFFGDKNPELETKGIVIRKTNYNTYYKIKFDNNKEGVFVRREIEKIDNNEILLQLLEIKDYIVNINKSGAKK